MKQITREEAAALLEAATPGEWRGDRNDGTVKYAILAGDHEAPIVVLSVDHKNGTYGFGCGYGDADETQYADDPSADERLCIASPRLAHTVVALHDRIAELEATLAAERGDAAGAPPMWSSARSAETSNVHDWSRECARGTLLVVKVRGLWIWFVLNADCERIATDSEGFQTARAAMLAADAAVPS